MAVRRCEVCGAAFAARRSDARYCSATCRSRHHRGVAVAEPAPPRPCASMTHEEVLAAVRSAHDAAADLSRASMHASAPLCLRLRAAAAKVEAALRGEGL